MPNITCTKIETEIYYMQQKNNQQTCEDQDHIKCLITFIKLLAQKRQEPILTSSSYFFSISPHNISRSKSTSVGSLKGISEQFLPHNLQIFHY